MKKRVFVFWMVAIWTISLAFTACGPAGSGGQLAASNEGAGETGAPLSGDSAAKESGAYTFVDDLGREVTVEWPAEAAAADGAAQGPERVAALIGSFAQIWTLAGGEVHASADDAWDEFELEMEDDAVNLGNTKELSLEKLLASEPQLILASVNTRQNMEWRETLEATGIPTAYFEVNSFEDYLEMLNICTQITGREDLYEAHGLEVKAQIDEVKARRKAAISQAEQYEPPKVLIMRASASIIKAKNSSDSVLGEILKDLGCENIADSNDMLLENLSLERILEEDPDCIFFVPRGDDTEGTKAYIETYFKENPAWLELTAVKAGRVYFMDKMLFGMKPNHRWGEAYEVVEGILNHAESE